MILRKYRYHIMALIVWPVLVAAGLIAAGKLTGLGGLQLAWFSLLAQTALIGCTAPFFASAARGGLLRTLGLLAATQLAVYMAILILGRPMPAIWIVRSTAILAGFALLLHGVTKLASVRCADFGLLAGYAVALLMLGTAFYANPVLTSTRGNTKLAVIRTAVTGNPMLTLAGSAIDYDILISRRSPESLYHTLLIGSDHLYRYPRWWSASLLYCAFGGFAAAAAYGLKRRTVPAIESNEEVT